MKVIYLFICLLAAPGLAAQEANNVNDKQIRQQINNYLWNAARTGDSGIIESVISAGYDLNVQDERGYTAVILAAYNGHQTTMEKLLDGGADPCLRDRRGNTALMGAIFKGEIKIARRLIVAKCNPDTRNNAGQSAAMYAALFQRHALLEELRARGADMNATDGRGNNVEALKRGEINGY
ncbi:ankyrin repeat domain-containing protein [Salmonella enterica subsp. enterica serovar Lexington]|uniref:ankyrin repeat domain-containing protein n=1 Tax=Salmonella enterica TaxID=28901 RepID=UPI000FB02499|nr:ankyrin repeat domain-containing protein [Salmonella enterica subsp. enterica serovar Lexington]EAO2118128.1 ankyrin repeat domain-containing protein [Salmonella enterica]ECM3796756.1 ankyrin repeat domain-containing protein [Salmonella enterica subsp. enterica serovar Newport]EDV1074548.1 ankyrin repeat domain-containing protein [Salmonella enterica subsp. enterica]EDW0192063.1 ankyrin repeat domain-containing protein [Salmonella enterica subsp. enterica serovar Orion]EDW8089709.1 ankyrin 